jgi:hypothetical protein
MMQTIGDSIGHAAEVTTQVVATAAGMVAGAITPHPDSGTAGRKRKSSTK